MEITAIEFGDAVRLLRPRLVQAARRLLRCSIEEAEDTVSDVVADALRCLGEYDVTSGQAGLRNWLIVRLRHLWLRRTRNERLRRKLASAPGGVAPVQRGSAAGPTDFDRVIRSLPMYQRTLMSDWLEGYSHDEIARRLRVHRNTIGGRLEEAFARLRLEYEDVEELECSVALFAFCSRVTIYRKPRAPWRPWRDQHPPERRS